MSVYTYLIVVRQKEVVNLEMLQEVNIVDLYKMKG